MKQLPTVQYGIQLRYHPITGMNITQQNTTQGQHNRTQHKHKTKDTNLLAKLSSAQLPQHNTTKAQNKPNTPNQLNSSQFNVTQYNKGRTKEQIKQNKPT